MGLGSFKREAFLEPDRGLLTPKYQILDADIAGQVIAPSKNVKQFLSIQIAKSFGAEVTGVDDSRKLTMLRSIGADHVIDYTEENFT